MFILKLEMKSTGTYPEQAWSTAFSLLHPQWLVVLKVEPRLHCSAAYEHLCRTAAAGDSDRTSTASATTLQPAVHTPHSREEAVCKAGMCDASTSTFPFQTTHHRALLSTPMMLCCAVLCRSV